MVGFFGQNPEFVEGAAAAMEMEGSGESESVFSAADWRRRRP